MSDSDPSGPVPESPPTPEMRQWAGLPWVWAVPVVAAIIAGWLGYRALIERGPTITISFPTADGIEADRTTIRYKNVELGRVTRIGLTSDGSRVVVTAAMPREAEPRLRADTKFWVVRPRITLSGVTGLTTVVSGAYIGMLPGKGAPGARTFTGLETPPPKEGLVGGRRSPWSPIGCRRSATSRRSISMAFRSARSPITSCRTVTVPSRSASSSMRPTIVDLSGKPVLGGVRREARVGGEGVKLATEPLLTIVAGGIVFETPEQALGGAPSPPGSTFRLYADQKAAEEAAEPVRVSYRLFFPDSLRGVRVGTPVELRGITVGDSQGEAGIRSEGGYDPHPGDS